MHLTKDKKDLIFLHGYLADSNSFAYQIPFFKKYFNTYAFDFKGFGQNKGMDFPYSLDDYVNDLVAYIKTNGIEKPHVIAHSFGARVALKACYRYPNIFGKLVLTGAAGLKPKWSFKRSLKKFAYGICKPFCKKDWLLRFYSKDYRALDDVMKESFKKVVSEHLDGVLPFIGNNTLIVFGTLDKETPTYMAKRLHEGIKNSRTVFIKDAGHFCFIDKPYTFNMEVREFLLSDKV